MSSLRHRLPAVFLSFLFLSVAGVARAQTPVVLPNTISTIAGGGTTPGTVGAACAAGSPFTTTDTLGDGCPATQVGLSTNLYGVAADSVGNVYVLDQTNLVIHKIDAQSGIMTRAAGGSTTVGCAGQADKYGDNCLAATQTGSFGNPRGLSADPYGNLIIGGYSMSLVQIVCNAVSPLCTSAQIGYMRILAGYVSATNQPGTAVSGSTPGSAGDGTTAVGTSGTGVNQPRGAAADIYGNVYIADTANTRYPRGGWTGELQRRGQSACVRHRAEQRL